MKKSFSQGFQSLSLHVFYRFIDISDNNGVNRASITILRIGEGRGSKCQSHVGRAEGPGEVQLLNLGYPCFYKVRKVIQIGLSNNLYELNY